MFLEVVFDFGMGFAEVAMMFEGDPLLWRA